MTVFVVSLFLPYTIRFNVRGQSKQSQNPGPASQWDASQASAYDATAPVPNLIASLSSRAGTTADPTASSPQDYFLFNSGNNGQQSEETFEPTLARTLSISDPHSPTWGAAQGLRKPPSRAEASPPSLLLQREEASSNSASLEEVLKQCNSRDQHDPTEIFANAKWSVVPAEQGNGGLKNSVVAAEQNGSLQDKTWVGTLGMPTDVLEGTEQKKYIAEKLASDLDSLVVFCKDSDFNGHYVHYCKQILSPVFHYQIPDSPKSKAYQDHSWVYYVKVNRAFADVVIKNYKRGDVIWIHDYHLILVPSMIREKLPDAQIGFFLHVAFPSSEVFRCLAVRKDVLEGLLGANLIGFQTEEYARHFLQTCNRLLRVEATRGGIQLEDRFVNVTNLAIGIDPISLDLRREDPAVAEWADVIKKRYSGKKLIVARDKLDHVRGVRQKMLAYELFLNKYPKWRDKVVLIQVAIPTSEPSELNSVISEIETRINSTHSSLSHQPVLLLQQDITLSQYISLLTVADCAAVTSLREGMNLTSQEFVCCQDGKYGTKKHGTLILSEFTGSASIFHGSQLSVNPWNYHQCADAFNSALEMGPEEREKRWLNLHKAVMNNTGAQWFERFLKMLQDAWHEQQARGNISIPRLSINSVGERYRKSDRRLFILDYEGTLAPAWGSPALTILTSPQRTVDVLEDLLLDDRNIVYVMSGRTPEELETLFRGVSKLGLIAENGCFLREFGFEEWQEIANIDAMKDWKTSVTEILAYYQERIPGTSVEHRHCSMIFHYDDAEDVEAAARQAGDCADHINEACHSQRVHAIPITRAILIEPMDWNKATAAARVLDKLQHRGKREGWHPDFLMVSGDDRDDEPVLRWANNIGRNKLVSHVTTVYLGNKDTEAMATISQGVTGMLSVLQKLANMA